MSILATRLQITYIFNNQHIAPLRLCVFLI